ncbi:MAG TPA: hypothetical protein PK811_00070 [bacterium]|nr:hypothetical protein [bacterium]
MYRLVHTKIDQDDWFLSLDLANKGLYLSLIVSSATNQLGVIKNSTRYLSGILGITEKELEERLGQLSDKVLYIKEQNIIYIKNFVKYQAGSVKSNKFLKMVKKRMNELPPEVMRKIIEFDPSLESIVVENDKNKAISEEEVGKSKYPMDRVSETQDRVSIGYHTVPETVTETESETVSESVTETEAQKNLNFNFSVREKEAAEKIIAILNKNSGNEDDALVEKIKEYIPEPADRVEVASVLSDICKGGLWQRRLKTVEDIPRYWDDIVQLYKAKPIAFSRGGGDGCKPDVDFKTLMENFKNSRRLE